MKKLKGFTLIELMVVIAIIGIFASLFMPAYVKFQDDKITIDTSSFEFPKCNKTKKQEDKPEPTESRDYSDKGGFTIE